MDHDRCLVTSQVQYKRIARKEFLELATLARVNVSAKFCSHSLTSLLPTTPLSKMYQKSREIIDNFFQVEPSSFKYHMAKQVMKRNFKFCENLPETSKPSILVNFLLNKKTNKGY